MTLKLDALLTSVFVLCLTACTDTGEHHVANDPGGGATGAVSSDMDTHASGAMNGHSAANGDPITNTGNLGSGSTESDPMNGSNQMGPAVPF